MALRHERWKRQASKILSPPEGKPKGSNRKTCAKCRSNVLNDHPDTMKLTDVVSGIMNGYEFKPKMHINYSEAIWKVKDGLRSSRPCPRRSAATTRCSRSERERAKSSEIERAKSSERASEPGRRKGFVKISKRREQIF
jgi:hypothetical protein